MSAKLHEGDCLDILKTMPDNSIDSIVTDPPYGLSNHATDDVMACLTAWTQGQEYLHSKSGFMGRSWDSWVPGPEVWKECFRVLKPGGHLLAFSGTRSIDLSTIAIRLAGFEIRDQIGWLFGSSMPKGMDISKAIDKAAGAEREVVGTVDTRATFDGRQRKSSAINTNWRASEGRNDVRDLSKKDITLPTTDAAKEWEGWNTSIKPAYEPIVWATKKFDIVPYTEFMVSFTFIVEILLWLTLPAKFVEKCFQLTQVEQKEAKLDSVRWIVAANHGTSSLELSVMTDMFNSREMAETILNIVNSWNSVSDAFLSHGNTFIIEIISEMTTELRTLKSSILEITPATIILEGMKRNGLWLSANIVENLLREDGHGRAHQPNNIAQDSAMITLAQQMECKRVKIADKLSKHQNHIRENSVQSHVQRNSAKPKKSCALSEFVNNVELSLSQSLVGDQNTVGENAWQKPIGSNITPSWEPICVARKPLIGTVVDNVLAYGTGGYNIDACRIAINPDVDDPRLGGKGKWSTVGMAKNVYGDWAGENIGSSTLGRFPTNVIHDGSDEVMESFAAFGEKKSGKPGIRNKPHQTNSMSGTLNMTGNVETGYGDSGSVSRYFYCAKANKTDRVGSKHPTVKPLALMRYLCKLVTPKGGTVLDPFAGSGTTGQAAIDEGFNVVLIEREAEYCADIRHRLVFFLDDTE